MHGFDPSFPSIPPASYLSPIVRGPVVIRGHAGMRVTT